MARAALEQAKTTMKGTRVTKHAREELAKWLDGFANYIGGDILRGKKASDSSEKNFRILRRSLPVCGGVAQQTHFFLFIFL